MKLIDALKSMVRLFCVITTFEVMFIAALGAYIEKGFTLEAWELIKIPFVAFVSVLPILILVRSEKAPRWEYFARGALHLALTAFAVFSSLYLFGWIDSANMVFTAFFFVAIYLSAFAAENIREKRLADKFNERIKAYHAENGDDV
jgi:hypothetical protein